jgi:hypothetical protein
MKTFVIFDRRTGAVLQTHIQADEHHGDLQDLLRTARPEAQASRVDVLEVEEWLPGASHQVDVKSKKLVPAGRSKTHGGSGGATVLTAGGDPRAARTEIYEVKREEDRPSHEQVDQ